MAIWLVFKRLHAKNGLFLANRMSTRSLPIADCGGLRPDGLESPKRDPGFAANEAEAGLAEWHRGGCILRGAGKPLQAGIVLVPRTLFSEVLMAFEEIWSNISKIITSRREMPSPVKILRDHIDENQTGKLDVKFAKDQNYFQVLINEMYLGTQREWLTKVDPVVYAYAEFIYGGQSHGVPFLVGPNILKQRGVSDQFLGGLILRNTDVTGVNPYRGGALVLSVVLCEAKGDNLLRPLLKVIENTAGALDFSPATGVYIKVAKLVMDGFDQLFGTGMLTPLVGLRDMFGPTLNMSFQPGYFALIAAPGVAPEKLWVRDRQLVTGPSLKDAKPFRDADFVLYSINSLPGDMRDDYDTLPFNALWERVKTDASSGKDDPNFASARQQMSTLYQSIMVSPDLTDPQRMSLADQYFTQMNKIHENAKKFGLQAGPDEQEAELDAIRIRALEIAKGGQ